MKKLTASLHHPNGDVMETLVAMDYEQDEPSKFLVRVCKRWREHILGSCLVVIGCVSDEPWNTDDVTISVPR
jgi:hypothetical protein